MATQAMTRAPHRSYGNPAKAILLGGSIVGILDLAYAILVYSPRNPIRIGQAIASGVLGAQSYEGGLKSAALGVVLHFLIAFIFTAIYYLASRRLRYLRDQAVVAGLIYGALVYQAMHWIVLPLSAVPPGHTPFIYKAFEFVEHWFFVGLPISMAVRRYDERPETKNP